VDIDRLVDMAEVEGVMPPKIMYVVPSHHIPPVGP
jgi:DNA-binding transcriptional MocR family regulator